MSMYGRWSPCEVPIYGKVIMIVICSHIITWLVCTIVVLKPGYLTPNVCWVRKGYIMFGKISHVISQLLIFSQILYMIDMLEFGGLLSTIQINVQS